MSTVCNTPGKPDLYGLGIRTSFYIQWFATMFMQLVDDADMADLRMLGLLLSGGMTIALIVQVVRDDVEAAEIYVMLLLAVGAWLFLVPLYVWRALTLCSPYWNPFRWSRERQSPIYKFSSWAVLMVLASLAAWFYTTYLTGLDKDCTQYGFLFTRVSLENRALIALNCILYFLIIIVGAFLLFFKLGCEVHMWSEKNRRRKVHKAHKELVRVCCNISNLVVFGVLITATELAVTWNHLDGVNGVDTAAQTLPLVLVSGFVLRVFFLNYVRHNQDDGSEDSSTGGSRRTSYRRATIIEETIGGPGGGGPMFPGPAHTRR